MSDSRLCYIITAMRNLKFIARKKIPVDWGRIHLLTEVVWRTQKTDYFVGSYCKLSPYGSSKTQILYLTTTQSRFLKEKQLLPNCDCVNNKLLSSGPHNLILSIHKLQSIYFLSITMRNGRRKQYVLRHQHKWENIKYQNMSRR